MTLVLGVDAGGTSTRAAIADGEGRLLGRSVATAGNLDDGGPSGVAAAVMAATRSALEVTGIGADATFDAVFLGVAGVVSAADRRAVLDALPTAGVAPRERIRIDHDCRVALAGGLAGRPGIVVIAGTGSAAFGVDGGGARWRSGGWGALVGDEGSSYSIAVEALRAVVRAVDGRGPSTALQAAMLGALQVQDPDDLLHRLHLEGLGRAEVAALAPLVVLAAEQGDLVAAMVLDTAAEQLAQMVDAVQRNLRFDGPVEVASVGGLFAAGEPIASRFREALERRSPSVCMVEPELDPVLGACLLALQSLGAADGALVSRLRSVRDSASPSGAAEA
ncbi:BadF/BadG/BcrA/BcrD ATPase family protein [Agrococcus sp. BE272]|uniref:N-acetylglucosamine kinase n=1 Tax=Agrococcus sp. BE272 TaxID=2817727 RepID=UPI00286B1437|nr:BadF/BadG/BcrA/BcrD ATPase family protein [Agrococcus sp. BE272]